ncbi:uncharacterized protein LOC109830996 [Asparagus officinalis]|uniref:uncharacterized protein LOC109830996 n=1 Tax=Asparagus officinalis TaxID=4686 RepID=UPI00098E5C01|nr:uncharacterized protein LOC109830996 [Asparagus officinalis]
MQIVSEIWKSDIQGYTMYSVCTKLKMLKGVLKVLNKRHFYNISEQVQRAKFVLEDTQKKLQNNPLDPMLICQEKENLSSYNKLMDCEVSFYQQKARIAWSVHGDRSTSYFHVVAKRNRHNNNVVVLYSNRNIIKAGPCLLESQIRELSKPNSKEEIKEEIFSMSDNKAPGPDEYSVSFFKTAWPVIGEEVLKSIEDFFKNGKLLGSVNSTSITLVPEVQFPNTPADFRPIACCNCLYKFISKILANRIKSVMGYLVDEAQSAFVKGRQISSNIFLAHELVKSYNRKHISLRVMLNIDIKKAFDTISWNFLTDMLEGLNFPVVMINWIKACISYPKYSISLNGSLHGYFKGKRGLRQGDPLSPYLFILGMEYLSRSLNSLKNDRLFKFHPRCSKLKITHLIFTDDLLLFAKCDIYSVQKLYQCVKEFSEISGLVANPEKSSIFYGGLEESVKISIASLLGFTEGTLPIKYLGVPLISKWLSFLDCSPHFSKISGVLHKIDEICRNFLWGKTNQIHRKPPLVSWVYENYLKQGNIWQINARKSDSWMWKQLLKVRNKALAFRGDSDNLKMLINSCCKNSKVKLSALYEALSPVGNKVSWYKTYWEDLNVPKHSFIHWLVVQNKLLTQDRLMKRGIITVNACSMCAGACLESRDHLFFECIFSCNVWNHIME